MKIKSLNLFLVLISSLPAFTFAQSDMLARYSIVSGGFGRNGGQSTPVAESTGDAAEISDALTVAVDGSGFKRVGIVWGGITHGLACQNPKLGQCQVEVVVPVNSFDPKSNSIQISGNVAEMIWKALNGVKPHKGPAGIRKSVANLVCTDSRETGPIRPLPIQCRIRDFAFTNQGQTLRQIVQSGFLSEPAAIQILKDSGVR